MKRIQWVTVNQLCRLFSKELQMEIQKQPSQDVVKQWIGQINKNAENLTEWEKDFMKSVTVTASFNPPMSPKRIEVIERIYCNKIPLRRFKD